MKHIVRTFSRVFPDYHPRAGEPTYFVEKIYNSIFSPHDWSDAPDNESYVTAMNSYITDQKHHTIRAGHHFQAGDFLVPRVWSGKPYKSKQIQIAPPIEIVKTWDFEIDSCGVYSIAKPGEQLLYTFQALDPESEYLDDKIAANDGLSPQDFYHWFSRSPDFKKNDGFKGQIICWNKSIEYLQPI